MFRFKKVAGVVTSFAVVAAAAPAFAVDTVTLPAALTPTGIATALLTDNAAQISGVVGIAFVSTLVVAAIHIIRSRFGKKGGSVVK